MPLTEQEEQEYQQLKNQVKPADNQLSGYLALKKQRSSDLTNLSQDAAKGVAGSFGGGMANAAVKGIGEATGLSKLPGWLMGKATNLKNAAPGVGQELVDQGLWGTSGMMKGQVSNKLGSTGAEIGQAVETIPGNLSHAPVADSVGSMSGKFTTPSGATTEAAAPSLAKVQSRANDISTRPDAPAKELFGYKKIAQGEGYNAVGDPLAKIQSQLAQKEASGYGKVLEDAYKQANPSNPDQLSNLNKSYSALKAGEKGLNRSSGTGLDALFKRAIPTEAVQSVGAQGLNAVGKAAPVAAQMGTQAAIQASPTNSWSDSDEQEYQQLKSQIQALQGSK